MDNSVQKRTIREPKRKPKRRFRADRAIIAAIAATLITTGVGKGINILKEHLVNDSNPIYTEDALQDLSNFVSQELDNFKSVSYSVNEPITVYIDKENSEEKIAIGTIDSEQQIEVYGQTSITDPLGNIYYYCNNLGENQFCLINAFELSQKATQLGVKDTGFDQLYKISTEPGTKIYTKIQGEKDAPVSSLFLQNGDIVFADTKNAVIDSENNAWIAIRSNDGKIAYTLVDDSLQRIDDGILVEVTPNVTNIIPVESSNLNDNVENILIGVQPGDRMIVIGEGSSDKTSLVLTYNNQGIAITGEISNDLIQEIEFGKIDIIQNDEQQQTDTVEKQKLDSEISNWIQDYQSGTYGIDISASMTPERIRRIIKKFSKCKIWNCKSWCYWLCTF